MSTRLRYMPDADELALAGALEGAIAEVLPVARLHAGSGDEDADRWRQLDALGILTAGVEEASGGSGLGAVGQAIMAVALGRMLATPAVLATMATAGVLPASQPHRVAAGFAGEPAVWAEEGGATHVLLHATGEAALHAMPAATRQIDDATWGVRLMTAKLETPVAVLSSSRVHLLRILYAAALAGNAAATLDMAVAYAKVREQFGRPIGSFQAVKHHCADMAIAARSACDLSMAAAVALDDGRDDAGLLVASAALVAREAAIGNAGLNIQIHGGIGFSAEADPHLFLKRAHLIAALDGNAEAAALALAAAIRRETSG